MRLGADTSLTRGKEVKTDYNSVKRTLAIVVVEIVIALGLLLPILMLIAECGGRWHTPHPVHLQRVHGRGAGTCGPQQAERPRHQQRRGVCS